ncbi:hypothetical protein ACNKHL_13725 [Shigella flexneri]
MRRWRVLSAYATSLQRNIHHFFLNGLRFQLRFWRTICCLRLVVFQPQRFAGVLPLRCVPLHHRWLASISGRSLSTSPAVAGSNAITNAFSGGSNMIGAAVDALAMPAARRWFLAGH